MLGFLRLRGVVRALWIAVITIGLSIAANLLTEPARKWLVEQRQGGWAVTILRFLVNQLPAVLWVAGALIFIVLLVAAYVEERRSPKVVTYTLKHRVLPHVGFDIRNALSGIQLAMNEAANTLIVTGTAAQQAEVKKIVDAVDVEGYQGVPPPAVPDFPTIEFYDSREMLIRLRGGIHEEAQNMAHGWAAWWVGSSVGSIEIYMERMDRLLMYHPDSDVLRRFAEITGEPLEDYQAAIRTATRIARRRGVEVKWSQEPITNLTIDDRKKPDAFARVEVLIPCQMNIPPHAILSSYVVRRDERGALFEQLVRAYQGMWDLQSNVIPER